MVTVVFAGEPPCKVAVMQLCMEKTLCYVLHIAHSGVPPKLKSLLEDNSSIKVGNFAWVLCCYPQMFFTFPLYYALLRSVNSLICVLSGWNMHRQRCNKNVEWWCLCSTIDGLVNPGKCSIIKWINIHKIGHVNLGVRGPAKFGWQVFQLLIACIQRDGSCGIIASSNWFKISKFVQRDHQFIQLKLMFWWKM